MAQDLLMLNPGRGRKRRRSLSALLDMSDRARSRMGKRRWMGAVKVARKRETISRRRNPRGIAWSGCVARPKHRGRRVRMIRYAAGRRPSAFTWSRFIGRSASNRLLKACRRAKRGGCSPMKRSITKRACRGRKSGGKTRCFTARGKRVCFKVKR